VIITSAEFDGSGITSEERRCVFDEPLQLADQQMHITKPLVEERKHQAHNPKKKERDKQGYGW